MINLQSSLGALAQLARALRWQCRGHRFDSDMLHRKIGILRSIPIFLIFLRKESSKSLVLKKGKFMFVAALVFIGFQSIKHLKNNQQKKYFDLGNNQYESANYNQALKSFVKSSRLKKSKEVYYNIALCHENLHEFKKAIEFYNKSIDKGHFALEVYWRRAHCYYQINEFGKSLSGYNFFIKSTVKMYLPQDKLIGRLDVIGSLNKYGGGAQQKKLLWKAIGSI